MDSIIYLVISAVYVVLLAYGMKQWGRDPARGPRYLLFLVTSALIWDNGIMGMGNSIGEGEMLEGLNLARFWLHAFFTPLLAVVSFDLIRRSGSAWAQKPAAYWGIWLFTAALIVLELVTETLGLEIKAVEEFGALRYISAEESSGPPIMILFVLIPLIAAGIILWKRKITPVLFWGTILMTIGSAVPIEVDSSAATNIFELILIASLWYSIGKLARK